MDRRESKEPEGRPIRGVKADPPEDVATETRCDVRLEREPRDDPLNPPPLTANGRRVIELAEQVTRGVGLAVTPCAGSLLLTLSDQELRAVASFLLGATASETAKFEDWLERQDANTLRTADVLPMAAPLVIRSQALVATLALLQARRESPAVRDITELLRRLRDE